MKKQVVIGMNGKEITKLIPENEADLEEINRLYHQDEIDLTDYMHGEKPAETKKDLLI